MLVQDKAPPATIQVRLPTADSRPATLVVTALRSPNEKPPSRPAKRVHAGNAYSNRLAFGCPGLVEAQRRPKAAHHQPRRNLPATDNSPVIYYDAISPDI